jgi:nitrate/nitrite-specific signal transduction histidine kinase
MQKTHRRYLGNFFIKRSLQIRLILKIVVAAILATIICSCTLLLVYYLKYNSVLLYQMDQLTNLTKENIIFIILPSLLISSLVNFIIAVCLGLYASRKYAVPIYKLEQWARMIRQGKISAKIQFREKEEMKELSDDCNNLTSDLREKFIMIKKQTMLLKDKTKDSPELQRIDDVLSSLQLEAETIEIHTSSLRVAGDKKK